MKENIYTIPVTDAFLEKGECPFCNMHNTLSTAAIEYILGPAYMEDDIRMETNAQGFCKDHYQMMYAKQNRLGLALMSYTHLKKVNEDLSKLCKDISTPIKKSYFHKNAESKVSTLSNYISKTENSCYVCNKIENTFARYIDTFFYMWKKDDDIKKLTKESAGFCLNHFNLILSTGEKKLSEKEYQTFLEVVVPIQINNLKRVEEELDWFTKKFDHRFADEPWKNSKDALPRSILKLSSLTLTE